MIVIWRGAGIAVPIVAFACLVLTELSVERAFRDERYYQRNGWPVLVALMAAAAIVWFVGVRLNRRARRVLVDSQTGIQVGPRSAHTLFFIPMQYWAPILAAAGIVLSFVIPLTSAGWTLRP